MVAQRMDETPLMQRFSSSTLSEQPVTRTDELNKYLTKVAFLLQEGTSNYFKGLMLILCYLIVAASFFVHVDSSVAGNVWSATAHIITGVIGAGVLSLAWSTAQLGWIAGPLSIILFAVTTLVSSYLLCDCYRFPHPEDGPTTNHSYIEAVKVYLGERREKVSAVLVYISLYGSPVAYVITTAISISFIIAVRWEMTCEDDGLCSGDEATCQQWALPKVVIFDETKRPTIIYA